MRIKDLRTLTGLTQKAFSDMYHIPLQTLKQWESSPESSSYRRPPEYVVFLLERLVAQDFGVRTQPLSKVEHLIEAGKHSEGCLSQWLRYLRKEMQGAETRLSKEQIEAVLNSDDLSMCQKIVFKRAMTPGTETNKYVRMLNDRAATPMIDAILRRKNHDN